VEVASSPLEEVASSPLEEVAGGPLEVVDSLDASEEGLGNPAGCTLEYP
jgi:hypothetical protein